MNEKFYSMSPEEFIKNAKMPVRVMESEAAMYEEIAEIMASTIEKKNGERCVIICPVGPIGQYPIFAKKVNDRRISLIEITRNLVLLQKH